MHPPEAIAVATPAFPLLALILTQNFSFSFSFFAFYPVAALYHPPQLNCSSTHLKVVLMLVLACPEPHPNLYLVTDSFVLQCQAWWLLCLFWRPGEVLLIWPLPFEYLAGFLKRICFDRSNQRPGGLPMTHY